MKASFIKSWTTPPTPSTPMDPSSQVSSLTPFLNSVCPGYTGLDDNVHYPWTTYPMSVANLFGRNPLQMQLSSWTTLI